MILYQIAFFRLDDVDNIPFDDGTLEEFEYEVALENYDDPETPPVAPTSPVEITHSSLISDSLQEESICLLDWGFYLLDIGSLFLDSHILDLGDTFECLSFLFDDDSYGLLSLRLCLRSLFKISFHWFFVCHLPF